MAKLSYSFVRNHPTILQRAVCFTFLPTVDDNSCFSTSSSAFGVVSVPGFGHSNRCVVVPVVLFSREFPWWHLRWSLFFVCLHGICMFFEVFVKVFGSFFLIELFVFLLLSCKYSLFWKTVLYQMYVLKILAPIPWLVSSFLTLSFTEQKFLMMTSLAIISLMDCTCSVVFQKASPYSWSSRFGSYVLVIL